jgi:acetylornithine deacetylase/succinyl-diaminopimelate desuccinylase-like protein
LRADALLAASQFITQASQLVGHEFSGAVITCGDVRVKPGVYNVVPSEAAVRVEFRASSATTLRHIEQTLHTLAEDCTTGPDLSFNLQPVDRLEPVEMAASVQTAIRRAGDKGGYSRLTLSSGAAHDAQALASITPSGMIFVPSKGGRSHCPEEDTAPADLVAGADVLLQTVIDLAKQKTVA